jgi:hypothetical protein
MAKEFSNSSVRVLQTHEAESSYTLRQARPSLNDGSNQSRVMSTQLRPLFGHQVALPHIRQIIWQFLRAAAPASGPARCGGKLYIQIVTQGTGDQRPQDRVVQGGFVVSGEQSILSSYGHTAQGAFTDIIIYAQAGIARVHHQRRPPVQRVADGLGDGAPRQPLCLLFDEPEADLPQDRRGHQTPKHPRVSQRPSRHPRQKAP